MEIINDTATGQGRPRNRVSASNIYLALMFIAAGLILLLYYLGDGIISTRLLHNIFAWEVVPLVIGGYLLTLRRWIAGGVVTLFGVFLLLGEHFHLHLPLGQIILPCLLIALGIAFLVPRK